MAEGGDGGDPVLAGDLQDRHAVVRDDPLAVDVELDEFHAPTPS